MLDLENLSVEEKTFYTALYKSGFPVDNAELRAEFAQLACDAGLTISNPSEYSPFWCFVTQAAIQPVHWLTAFLVRRVMPGLYVKTAGGALLEVLAWSYGIERKSAARAVGMLTFSRPSGSSGAIVVPEGTVVRSDAVAGVVRRMITGTAATIAAGVGSVDVPAVADGAGSAWNLASGAYCAIDDDNPQRLTVSNGADFLVTPGADEETDLELRLRLRNHFSAAADWHTDAKYKAMISERIGFRVDRLFFVHDAPRGAGTANCYALFDSGVDPTAYLAEINAYISDEGNHGHGDDLVVYAMPSSHYVVHLQLGLSGAADAAARTAIQTMIRCAFRQNSEYLERVTQTWPYASFSWSRLDYELHAAFPTIQSLTWEYRAATAAEAAGGAYDATATGWTAGDIASTLDVPRLAHLIMEEV